MNSIQLNILAFLGSIGMPEMMAIFVMALLFLGPKKLPGLARSIGKGLGEFKQARAEFEKEITKAIEDDDSSSTR